ncbi:hypothetical protein CTW87_15585 [Salmonella enterica]|nr:hypothetical protein [Salmonella enterica]
MKKRHSKAEMIKMRNSCIEIKRRLCRAENISDFMQYLATKDNPQIKAAFCYYMGGMLSFLSDDINYIHDEINNIDFFFRIMSGIKKSLVYEINGIKKRRNWRRFQ